jgi:hypothetical protein
MNNLAGSVPRGVTDAGSPHPQPAFITPFVARDRLNERTITVNVDGDGEQPVVIVQ